MILPASFYRRSTLFVARDLLGCVLARRLANGKIERLIISEVEAYHGHSDLASHASRGRTARNGVMFGPAGRLYIYLIYGMYQMLNIVTGPDGFPAAVLIRGALPLAERSLAGKKIYAGPGRLTKSLNITAELNGQPVYRRHAGLWVESRPRPLPPRAIKRTPRIGVEYAKEYKDKPWRFLLNEPWAK